MDERTDGKTGKVKQTRATTNTLSRPNTNPNHRDQSDGVREAILLDGRASAPSYWEGKTRFVVCQSN